MSKRLDDWNGDFPGPQQDRGGTETINLDVDCRLRITGSFFLRCGVMQHCLMLNWTMNVSFPSESRGESFFSCVECPNTGKRDELLESYRDHPDCASCGKNIATREVVKEVTLIPGMEPIKAGSMVCISCFKGVEIHDVAEKRKALVEELRRLEQEYQEGKIPYSEIIELKEKIEKLETSIW